MCILCSNGLTNRRSRLAEERHPLLCLLPSIGSVKLICTAVRLLLSRRPSCSRAACARPFRCAFLRSYGTSGRKLSSPAVLSHALAVSPQLASVVQSKVILRLLTCGRLRPPTAGLNQRFAATYTQHVTNSRGKGTCRTVFGLFVFQRLPECGGAVTFLPRLIARWRCEQTTPLNSRPQIQIHANAR